MGPQVYRQTSGYQPGSPRERLIASVLSIAVILIVILAMIFQFVVSPERDSARRPVTFNVANENSDKAAKRTEARPRAPQVATRSPEKANSPPRPRIVIKSVEKADTLDSIPGFIRMSRSDLSSADIGKMKGPAQGSESNGKGQDARTAYGPGEGPGGVMLYDADWYRRPTDAQLATYMPQNGRISGWGLIACQTVPRYHVENCQIMGESPRGSGFGRAVQNAAWQFLVLPPRINSKPQIGAWVRIRIDYRVRTISAPEPGSEPAAGEGPE